LKQGAFPFIAQVGLVELKLVFFGYQLDDSPIHVFRTQEVDVVRRRIGAHIRELTHHHTFLRDIPVFKRFAVNGRIGDGLMGKVGFFNVETHEHGCGKKSKKNKKRKIMTSIYYLLTRKNPLSWLTVNEYDLILYYHLGDPLKIIFLQEDGSIQEKILGPDLLAGQVPQLLCPGGIPKAYDLMEGQLCLVGEAVTPGFEYEDMKILSLQEIKKQYPRFDKKIELYIQP
jgi:predicted cupin superfamily sugar epimerase